MEESEPPSEIIPNFLYLGSIEHSLNEELLKKYNIKGIVNVAEEVTDTISMHLNELVIRNGESKGSLYVCTM